MGLEVAIEKRLPGFTLEVAFTAANRPVGVLGASGAGKTMLLRALAGLEGQVRGRITLDGRVLFDAATGVNVPSRERRVSLLFQHYALFPHLTVERNIAFGLRHLRRGTQQERARVTTEQVAAMHLTGLEQRYPGALSGGQQQRVALARALAPQPGALLLDEPFSALDTHLRSQLEKQLRETLEGYAGVTLLVSHNLEEIYRLCAELIVLDKGRIIAQGPREEIFHRAPNRMTAQLTGCKNFSRVRVSTEEPQLFALDWGCSVRTARRMEGTPGHVAIRAHHVRVGPRAPADGAISATVENAFPCWLGSASEAPFRVTLFLRLNGPPESATRGHPPPENSQAGYLQAEITQEQWSDLKAQPQPWTVVLDPDRLFLLPD